MKNIIEFLIRTNCPPILVDDVGKYFYRNNQKLLLQESW